MRPQFLIRIAVAYVREYAFRPKLGFLTKKLIACSEVMAAFLKDRTKDSFLRKLLDLARQANLKCLQLT